MFKYIRIGYNLIKAYYIELFQLFNGGGRKFCADIDRKGRKGYI